MKPMTQLMRTAAAGLVVLGLAGTAQATSTCTAPYQHKGQGNALTLAEGAFSLGQARYIVNPTYPHTPCARLCRYVTPVPGQVCPHRPWFKGSDPLPRTLYCSSNPACTGYLTDQQVTDFNCDPAEEAWEEGLVADIEENTELITMNLQHWQKDLRLSGTRYVCVLGELGLR